VTEADPEVQKFLKAMQLLTGAYGNDFEISRNCVVKPLKHRSGSAKRSGQYLFGALGTAATREQSRRYDSLVQAVEKAQEGLRAVAEGHAALAENVGTLTATELASKLRKIVPQINDAREVLKTLNAL